MTKLILKIGAWIGMGTASVGSILIALGAAVAGIVVVVGLIWTAGYNYRDAKCDAAAQKLRAESLQVELKETKRQLAATRDIQAKDAERARVAEERLRANEESINATPKNDTVGLPADAARRVRNTR